MRRQTLLVMPSLVLALLGPACVSEEPSAEPPADISKHIVDKAPEGLTPLNVNFDNKITLLGVQVEPGLQVSPGKRVTLTMYWRAEKALGDSGWKLFTHVLDGSGDRLLNIDNVGPLRHAGRTGQAWPPSNWQPGKIYVDRQSFTVPRKVKSSEVQVVSGIWRGRDRLPLESGPSAGDNRALVATLSTTGNDKAKRTRIPEIEVSHLEKGTSLEIDGKLDEPAWRDAAGTSDFINVSTGAPHPESPVQGSAKLLWDDKWLYVGMTVKDENLSGGFDEKQQDPHLWTKDCVEIMIDPDESGDNQDYYEIQINPQNLVFDSQFDTYNQPRDEKKGQFGHQEWRSKLVSAVQLEGTLDNAKDKDKGYVVEAKIPWASFDKAKQAPPKPGSTWRLNLYAMHDNNGVAWSPILEQGNFHKASRFGRVTWSKEKVTTAPASLGSSPAKQDRALSVSKKTLRGTSDSPKPSAPRPPEAPAAVAPSPSAPATSPSRAAAAEPSSPKAATRSPAPTPPTAPTEPTAPSAPASPMAPSPSAPTSPTAPSSE